MRGWLTVLLGVHAVSLIVHFWKFFKSIFVISLTPEPASESVSER